MIKIIPSVKSIEIKDGFLEKSAIFYNNIDFDKRLISALEKLPFDKAGAKLNLIVIGDSGEDYEIVIGNDFINIKAAGPAGAFYAIQTLRQIFKNAKVPCLYIKDSPDFPYRGFYHDVTRGRVPTVDTIKKLIDQMAYYKLNSLQLYVEHTFEFEECKDLIKKTGYLTKEEIREIGEYCKQNFIEFIPSLSTFGHLYELLQQEKYQHLRVLKDFEEVPNFWNSRMRHHTIDPLEPESIEVIKSLIDQYAPYFESEFFNICCDETFDLTHYAEADIDEGRLYVDFVKQIIEYVKAKGKKIMMWADILLKHPETIKELPEDIYFLNWSYSAAPKDKEEKITHFNKLNRKQIVCPGTTTWNRFCENVDIEEKNISIMAEYGYKHGALGVLNTNWGDWGNPCSLELGLYGMVLGAEKSWSVNTKVDDEFYTSVNFLLYENENGIKYLKQLSRMHDLIDWKGFCTNYFTNRYKTGEEIKPVLMAELQTIQNLYRELADKLSGEVWINDEYRREMLSAAEGVCVVAELSEKISGKSINRISDTKKWLQNYRELWLKSNKESELKRIEEMFLYCEEN